MPTKPDFWGGFPPKPRSVLRNRQGIPQLSGVSSRAHKEKRTPVQPVRGERGLARRLAKEDRHLSIAPRLFDRHETPAIFVTSLVFDQSEMVRHVERKYYRRRSAAWPFAAVNLPFRLRAHGLTNALAGNWSTEIQIPGDPKQQRNVAVRRSRYPRRPARLLQAL